MVRDRIVPANTLFSPPDAREQHAGPFFVTTFFPGIQRVNAFLRNCHRVLLESPDLREVFPRPFFTAYRGAPTLENKLSHKVFTRHVVPAGEPGLNPCGNQRCKLCPLVVSSPDFTSPNTPFTYRTRGRPAICQTTKVVYRLECTRCESFYIGKTSTQLNQRINNHRSACNRGLDQPPVRHAQTHNLQSFDECYRVRVLDSLGEDATDMEVRFREQAYQWALGAFRPPGINVYS
ncbi:hypothetical protein GE061_008453 [Apolygus lucorum]|uniref:GIY-YIG domain-containing protein n=1 Tax=Apolygus lucorum TaxID=248454 RepID=A0A8S9WRC5_APOLU|nr:hypothetical protein GE061_008453 [Apolygus lucorum]